MVKIQAHMKKDDADKIIKIANKYGCNISKTATLILKLHLDKLDINDI